MSRAIGDLVQPERLTWIVVGDRASIESKIRDLGWGDPIALDPDGNVVYFDTTVEEAPKSMQVACLLADLERYLSRAGIESSKFAAFKAELLERYASEVPDER